MKNLEGSLGRVVRAQDLAIFGEFRGEHYKRIKSMYLNENFLDELRRLKINIQGGYGLSLGARPSEASSIFFDDGQALRKYRRPSA